MIIENKQGNDILNGKEKRIAFAVNSEGVNDSGFADMISRRFWPELAFIGETELGSVLAKKVGDVEYLHSVATRGKTDGTTREILLNDALMPSLGMSR